MRSRKKKVNPIGLQDITIVDDAKMRKAITAAALGNAEKDLELAEADVHGWSEKNQIYDFISLINLIN